jgi:hypothetical protein
MSGGPVISDESAALASQILGLKKAVAANQRHNGPAANAAKKSRKGGGPGASLNHQEKSFDEGAPTHGPVGAGGARNENQMGTRSSSHGRLPSS